MHKSEKSFTKQRKNSDIVRSKLINRTAKCEKLSHRGQAALAQEVVQTVDLPHPIYIESAQGPYLTDLDGNRYIDLTGGFGPNVLGNKPEVIDEVILAFKNTFEDLREDGYF